MVTTTTPTLWKSASQANAIDGGTDQTNPRIVARQDGGYYIVWIDESGTFVPAGGAIVAHSFDAEGTPLPAEVSVAFNDVDHVAFSATLVPNDLLEVVVTPVRPTARLELFARTFNPNLTSVAPPFKEIDSTAADTTDPAITAFDDGSYVVTYTKGSGDDTDIMARIVSAAGVVGDEFTLRDQPNNANLSQLATLANGNFVVVYQDEFSETDRDIYYQVLSPTGAAVTGSGTFPYSVADSFDDEIQPDVAALTGGRFVVVWSDDDGAVGPGINATLFEANGTSVAGKVNFDVGGSAAFNPRVTGLADGGFLVAWEDVNTELIRAQRYDADANAVGAQFTVAQGSGSTNHLDVALLADGRIAFALGDDSSGDDDITHVIFDPRDDLIRGTNQADVITSRIDGATVKGRGGQDTLLGQDARDTLDGGTKADTMRGRGGNDIYVVDNVQDQVIEEAGEGKDLVKASVSFVLGANVEKLTLTGSNAIDGTGNELRNTIVGNDQANVLDGIDGNDKLFGVDGEDRLEGGQGKDQLNGGADNDILTGGRNPDKFIFDTDLKNNVDEITDFKPGVDLFVLDRDIFSAPGGKLSAGEFVIGKKALDANDFILYDPNTGIVYYDSNGNEKGGRKPFAIVDTDSDLDNGDFLMA